MIVKFIFRAFLGLVLNGIPWLCSYGQSQTSITETQVWPEVDARVQLPKSFRVLSFAGLQQAAGYAYHQVYAAAALGYQFKTILKPHVVNIDPDKEHHWVFGCGYWYLHTTQSGKTKNENRLDCDVNFNYRPSSRFLLLDRSRGESRWVNGVYSTTYRNRFSVERDFLTHGLRFSPYGAVEVFYDGSKQSWTQQWYTGGVQWPYKRLLMVNTYYVREICDTCTPMNWNSAGVTLNCFIRRKSKY